MHFTTVLVFLCSLAYTSALRKVRSSAQSPGVWDALDQLKGSSNRALTVDQIQELFLTVKPGEDFPLTSSLPQQPNIDCAQFHQPGFYADVDAGRCQIFYRCDINGNLTSYLCPNMTIFNQITLVCDWWFNVDCSQAKQFYDYSNSRLYQGADVPLLDDQMVVAASGAVDSQQQVPAKKSKKKSKKHAS